MMGAPLLTICLKELKTEELKTFGSITCRFLVLPELLRICLRRYNETLCPCDFKHVRLSYTHVHLQDMSKKITAAHRMLAEKDC